MSDRFGDVTPLPAEPGAAGGDTVPARGTDAVPQSPLEGAAGLGEAAGLGGGRDTVPFRGDSTPMPDSAVAGLGDAAPSSGDAAPALGDAAPSLGDAAPALDGAAPLLDGAASALGDAAPAVAALDGGASQTLAEAVHAVEGATELDGAGPGLERDLGEFVDGAGQGWDVLSPADIFRSGPNAGERMPAGQPGGYDGDTFENQLDGALAKGLNVVVDTSGLSKDANADARRRADDRPDWAGRVRFE